MPKLKLKRTPAEEREHQLRKARKHARRTARSRVGVSDEHGYVFDFPDLAAESLGADYHKQGGPSSASDADYQRALKEVQERRFRDKLADAFGEDEGDAWSRMDSVEADMNQYAHVPNRWRSGSARYAEAPEMREEGKLEHMDDEEYAEWIRRGMWRRTHAAEYEAAEKEKAAHAARMKEAKEARNGTRRLEREEATIAEQRRTEVALHRVEEARLAYEETWRLLLSRTPDAFSQTVTFAEIPWPVLPGRAGTSIELDDITPDALERFIIPPAIQDVDHSDGQKTRKDRLRETMLRFHPDKFESRVLKLVREEDTEAVKDGVGRVVRAVTELLQGG